MLIRFIDKPWNSFIMTSFQCLLRMRRTFAKNKFVLGEDYEHFTTTHAATLQSKAARKSVGRSELRSRESS